jgi:7-cyano-7-deazaguanine synthase in queuosine biosynthesis
MYVSQNLILINIYMNPSFTLAPTHFNYIIEEHFPKLPNEKKIGIFLSGGMESTLISIIATRVYGKDRVIHFFSDNIFSSNDPKRNSYIHTNLSRASKLLDITPVYLDFDYNAHIDNRKVSIQNKIESLREQYNVDFVMFGFTKLFFEVEIFKQPGMTVDQIKEIAFADPVRFKSTIEEFHLDTDSYTWHLLDIDIPAEVYHLLRANDFILSPFKDLNKAEVVDFYNQLDSLDILYGTSSCIRESLTEVGKHCGKCFNCQQRYDAFKILNAGINDQTEYESDEIVHKRKLLEDVVNA